MTARASTRSRVHRAALSLAAEVGLAGMSMEGIAARAGAGKQTLYRTWASPGAIFFDALLTRSLDAGGQVAVPDTGDLRADLETLVAGTIAELSDPATEQMLRAVTVEIQVSPDLADQMRDRLLGPQLRAIEDRMRRGGVEDPRDTTELLLGPLFHRWLLRTRPFDPAWPRAHVARVLRSVASADSGVRPEP